jgi:hypothetical protein
MTEVTQASNGGLPPPRSATGDLPAWLRTVADRPQILSWYLRAAASRSVPQAAFLAFFGRRGGLAVPYANRSLPPAGRPGRRVLPG